MPRALQSWLLTVFWKVQSCNIISVTVPHHGSCLFQAVRSLQCFINRGAQHSVFILPVSMVSLQIFLLSYHYLTESWTTFLWFMSACLGYMWMFKCAFLFLFTKWKQRILISKVVAIAFGKVEPCLTQIRSEHPSNSLNRPSLSVR